MIKKFTIGGSMLSALFGVGVMFVTEIKCIVPLGFYERMFQIALVAGLAVLGALLGLSVGWIASLIFRAKKEKAA